MEVVLWILVMGLIAAVIWALDRQWALDDVGKELNEVLGDYLVARDAAEEPVKVHYSAFVRRLKLLISHHFKFKL